MTNENDEWTGEDLAEFLDAYKIAPEQMAAALRVMPLTVRNWMKVEGPFAATDDNTHVWRLAMIGVVAEANGGTLKSIGEGPPMHFEILYYKESGRVEVSARQMVRKRRKRGTGARADREYVGGPLS